MYAASPDRLASRRLVWVVLSGVLSAALIGCTPPEAPADLVLQGGLVYTMELGAGAAEAIAVRDGRIVAVGTDAEIGAFVGPDTRVEALDGRVVLPGFVDAHTHIAWSGAELQTVDLYEATSVQELLDTVAAYAAAHPDESWIQGGGWEAPVFEGQLDRILLDGVVADRPVFLGSADAHSAVVNTRALAEAGITAGTTDPEGGSIERDGDGEPTGVLRETAVELVAEFVPEYSDALVDAGLAEGLAEAHAVGITTILDANVDEWVLDAYSRAEAAGTLGMRVIGAIEAGPAGDATQVADIVAMREAYTGEHVSVGAVKFYLDGVLESGTARMLEPYEDGTNGDILFADATLDALFAATDEAGLQIHVHAIGDGAIRQMLDAVERLPVTGGTDRRPIGAHLEVIDPLDVPRFAELGVYAAFQPLWAYPDTYITELTIPVIGADRAESLYPIGGVVATGGPLAAGSDWSVSSMNPWEAIEVAVTRQDPEDPTGEVLTPDQRVDLTTILAAYTSGGAKALLLEDELGTLAPGKRADLVVLDRDPFSVDAAALADVRVDVTWFEGREVYRRTDGATARHARRRH